VEGTIGAAANPLTNVGLRPVGRLVDRSPSSGVESETFYQFFLTCRAEEEPQIRGLLVRMVQREGLQLRDLASVDQDDGSLRVRAGLLVRGRDDTKVERVTSRLSLEKGVTRLRWNEGETFPGSSLSQVGRRMGSIAEQPSGAALCKPSSSETTAMASIPRGKPGFLCSPWAYALNSRYL